MTTTFTISLDHYDSCYGCPGLEVIVSDGRLTITDNGDLRKIRQTGEPGITDRRILKESQETIAILKTRIATAIASSGSIATFDGKPYINWEFPLDSKELHIFLKDGLGYDGAATPSAMLTEFRQRHCFETPLEFPEPHVWRYTTWCGTIVNFDIDYEDWVVVGIPLFRAIQEDLHFGLLNS